jgi:hypothetical protein
VHSRIYIAGSIRVTHLLKLWQVDLNLDLQIYKSLDQLLLTGEELLNYKSVAEYWSEQPAIINKLHILMEVVGTGGESIICKLTIMADNFPLPLPPIYRLANFFLLFYFSPFSPSHQINLSPSFLLLAPSLKRFRYFSTHFPPHWWFARFCRQIAFVPRSLPPLLVHVLQPSHTAFVAASNLIYRRGFAMSRRV